MAFYLKRLEKDLPRWVQAGWVSRDGASAILGEVEQGAERGWFRLPLVLAALGGILVFAGVVSLIASNWEEFPRVMKVAFPLGWMTLSFLAAYRARARKAEGLAEGLSLMGTLMFGASIMLIGQIYHLPPDPPAFFMMWAVAAAVVSFLWPSSLNAALAFVLAGFYVLYVGEGADAGFSFLPRPVELFAFCALWIPLVALCLREGWRLPLHVAGISVLLWISVQEGSVLFPFGGGMLWGLKATVLLTLLRIWGWAWPSAKVGLHLVSRYVWLGFGIWLLVASQPENDFTSPESMPHLLVGMLGGILVVSLWGLVSRREKEIAGMGTLASLIPLLWMLAGQGPPNYTHLFSDPQDVLASAILSVIVLIAALGSIIYGYRERDRFFVNGGFILFGIKLTWVYFETIWSLAGRSAWMILGGILVILLGIMFDRYRRRMLAGMTIPIPLASQENAP